MGHGNHKEASLDVDYGHVLSFYQRLKDIVDNYDQSDLYFVMNGDFSHGTFLGADPPSFISGILEKMPYDIVTIGDHELTNADSLSVLREPGGLFDEWGDRLITSNVRVKVLDDNDKKTLVPLGHNYKLLQGNQGTVLVLGFLYDMGSEAVIAVEKVEDVMQQSWFTSLFSNTAINEQSTAPQFDVLLVMAHMDVQDELITMLHATLREYVGPNMPIQFITGHTHKRAYNQLDEYSSSFEAGRYLDTIGYLSFDPQVANSMEHVFINANQLSLAQSLGTTVEEATNDNNNNTFPMTKDGLELSQYIQRTLDHSGANTIVGCSDLRYRVDGNLNETDSLFRLYLERVLPSSSYLQHSMKTSSHHSSNSHDNKNEVKNIFVQALEEGSSSVRYDLFPGVVTMNDIYGVVPVDDTIVKIGSSIRGDVLLKIVQQMEVSMENTTNVVGVAVGRSGDKSSQVESSSSILIPPYGIQNESMYTLHTLSQNAVAMQGVMIELDVPATSTTHSTKPQPMRNLWIDFIKREWPLPVFAGGEWMPNRHL